MPLPPYSEAAPIQACIDNGIPAYIKNVYYSYCWANYAEKVYTNIASEFNQVPETSPKGSSVIFGAASCWKGPEDFTWYGYVVPGHDRIGCRTESSNPSTTSSITAAVHGTR